MRIAYVLSAYPLPFRTYVVNEMLELQKENHEIILVPLHPAPNTIVKQERFKLFAPLCILPSHLFSLDILKNALLTLFAMPWRVLKTLFRLHRSAGWNPYQHWSVLAVTPKSLATVRYLKKLNVDRIHAHFATHTATLASIVGIVGDIPYSFTAHAYDIYCDALRVRNDTLAFKLQHAVQVFAVSNYGMKLLRAKLPAHHHERVQTIYVGIPLDLFREEKPVAGGKEIILLCVTRFEEKKGLDTLIDACALLRDRGVGFHLNLYGGGPLMGSLAQQIERLKLKPLVTLGGAMSQEEVAREMRNCHIFVMPCRKDRLGNMDGIPTVFMEAMATGRPVISCGVSGIPELVRDGETGLLVPPNDASALANAIALMSDNDSLRVRLGRGARALVERQHDQRLTVRHLLDVMIQSRTVPCA